MKHDMSTMEILAAFDGADIIKRGKKKGDWILNEQGKELLRFLKLLRLTRRLTDKLAVNEWKLEVLLSTLEEPSQLSQLAANILGEEKKAR